MNRMKDVNDDVQSVNDDIVNDVHQDSSDRMMKIMEGMKQQAQMNSNAGAIETGSIVNTNVDKSNYWEIKGLPTKGRLYPEGTLIEARPLKVIEVKKLSSLNDGNADYVINDILRRTVRGIKIDDIYLADKIFIIFWLRANTFRDSSYNIEFKCPKCEKDSKYHFELDNLKVNYLKDDYNPSHELTTKQGDKLTMRYLTIADELLFERFKEINSTVLDEIDDDLLGLACMINTVNGSKVEDVLEKYNYVLNTLTPEDFSLLSTYVDDNGIGVEQVMNVTCKECGGVAPLGVTFRPEFFLPKCSA